MALTKKQREAKQAIEDAKLVAEQAKQDAKNDAEEAIDSETNVDYSDAPMAKPERKPVPFMITQVSGGNEYDEDGNGTPIEVFNADGKVNIQTKRNGENSRNIKLHFVGYSLDRKTEELSPKMGLTWFVPLAVFRMNGWSSIEDIYDYFGDWVHVQGFYSCEEGMLPPNANEEATPAVNAFNGCEDVFPAPKRRAERYEAIWLGEDE